MPDVAVTGSTGLLGGQVARLLHSRGTPIRMIARDETRVPDLPGAEVGVAAYEEIAAMRRALAGARTVLMIPAGEHHDRLELHADFISAAAQADVQHIVYVSYLGADPGSAHSIDRDHGLTEQLLRDLDFDVTVLRCSHFATTMLDFAAWGDLVGPVGDGHVTPIAREDVAEIAASILTAPAPHVGKTYCLTGPQSLDFDQVAEHVAAHRGTECRYLRATDEQFRERLTGLGVPDELQLTWLDQYHQIREGEFARVTPDAERLLGRPPLPLAEALVGH